MPELTTRLLAALDDAEEIAKRACYGMSVHPCPSWRAELLDERGPDEEISKRWHVLNEAQIVARCPERATGRFATHIASWDPNTVLRLIARDRALLTDHEPHTYAMRVEGRYIQIDACGCSRLDGPDYTPYPCREIRRAAEFWLGDTG